MTAVYSKPTDRNTILHYDRSHPTHLHNNLPISQFLCVMRICSDVTTREKQLHLMSNKFLERGYPPNRYP